MSRIDLVNMTVKEMRGEGVCSTNMAATQLSNNGSKLAQLCFYGNQYKGSSVLTVQTAAPSRSLKL